MIEQSILSRDGTKLFYRYWPVSGTEDTVIIVHGYADHSGRYAHVAEFLNANGFGVYALDLRGHGKSEGRRGHIGSFSEYHEDLLAMVEHVCSVSNGIKPFLLAHSLGGLVVLSTLLNNRGRVGGMVLTSPFVGMSMKVSLAKVLLGRFLSRIYPALTLPNDINPAHLSRDERIGDAYREDPLVFKTATARWFTETLKAIDGVFADAEQSTIPCLFLQAGDERIADIAAARRLFKAMGTCEKTYVEYPGYRHEILNENGKEECLKDISRWLKNVKQA